MKRMILASLCLVLGFAVSAQESAPFVIPENETSRSAGFEFGDTLEHHPDGSNRYFGSPGMNRERYSFWNGGNFGMFYHGSWTFPVAGEDNHDFQWGAIIGPAFRIRFTDRLTLQTGIGLGGNGLLARYEESGTDYYSSAMFLAAGADAGLKFDITDTFFIKGGVNAAWSFLGWTNVQEASSGRRGWRDWDRQSDYWTLNANPYISFGINIYSPRREHPRPDGPRLGKPPREGATQQ
jgi:hypothetical protein